MRGRVRANEECRQSAEAEPLVELHCCRSLLSSAAASARALSLVVRSLCRCMLARTTVPSA